MPSKMDGQHDEFALCPVQRARSLARDSQLTNNIVVDTPVSSQEALRV